jgi:hypothetical protein
MRASSGGMDRDVVVHDGEAHESEIRRLQAQVLQTQRVLESLERVSINLSIERD